ncbi:MAG: uncharacterized protein KVP18_004584, partial [Porospora cf. gigantea A]
VEVKTAKNPIEEEYYIDVHRNPLAGESPQKARALGNFIGWGTAFLSADKAFSFLYNTKLLQWISATGRLNNSPETYDSFASSFHKWNLIFRNPERVRFTGGSNNTFVSPPERYAELIQMYDVQDASHANKDFLAALDQLGAAVPPFVISQNGNWVDVSPSEPLVTQSLRTMLFRQWNDNLVQVARDNHAVNVDVAENASPVRALREIAPADKTKLLRELNVEMKKSEAVLDYINSIFVTSCVLLGAAVMYMLLWLVWLRNKNAGFLTLRRDFPKILHPARFWTFLFDFTFVSFMMATAGIAFYSGKDCSVCVYGINTTPRQVQIYAIAMLIAGPLCYFLAAISIVTVIRKNLVFTKSTQTWQDELVIESKAMQTYLRWFPVVCDLLSIEIRGATPIFRPEDHAEGHTQVAFKEETRRQPDFTDATPYQAVGGDADKDGGSDLASVQYTSLLGGSSKPALPYDGRRDRVHVETDVEKAGRDYIVNNHMMLRCYPDANIGTFPFSIKNSYDHNLKLECELNIRHHPNVYGWKNLELMIPREHLQGPSIDRFSNLFAASHKNIFQFVIDRAALAMMCVFLTTWTDQQGYIQSLLLMCVCLLLVGLYVPSTLKTATSHWYGRMSNAAGSRRRQLELDEDDEKKFRIWPFRGQDTRAQFDRLRMRKTDYQMKGMYRAVRLYLVEPWQSFRRGPVFRSFASEFSRDVVFGPMWLELMKGLTLVALVLANIN